MPSISGHLCLSGSAPSPLTFGVLSLKEQLQKQMWELKLRDTDWSEVEQPQELELKKTMQLVNENLWVL